MSDLSWPIFTCSVKIYFKKGVYFWSNSIPNHYIILNYRRRYFYFSSFNILLDILKFKNFKRPINSFLFCSAFWYYLLSLRRLLFNAFNTTMTGSSFPQEPRRLSQVDAVQWLGSLRVGAGQKPLLIAGNAYHKYRVKCNRWPKVRCVAMNPVEHPHGGGSHQHIGHASTVRRCPSRPEGWSHCCKEDWSSAWARCCNCIQSWEGCLIGCFHVILLSLVHHHLW